MQVTDISISSGDTIRAVVRLTVKGLPLDLTGWTNFRMIVAATEDAAANDQIMNVAGQVVDGAEGRVAFVPLGTIPVGSYYYNCRGVDDNGERGTFKKGRYIVTKAME